MSLTKFVDNCIDRNINDLMQACRKPEKKYNLATCPFELNPENAELYEQDKCPCGQCDNAEQCFD